MRTVIGQALCIARHEIEDVPAVDCRVLENGEVLEAIPLRTRLRVLHPHIGQRTKSPKMIQLVTCEVDLVVSNSSAFNEILRLDVRRTTMKQRLKRSSN